MVLLYISADKISDSTGGGIVVKNESAAFTEFAGELDGCREVLVCTDTLMTEAGPFHQDETILKEVQEGLKGRVPQLVHCYSGCLTKTCEWLKSIGSRISYTIAAHDKKVSQREHEKIGLPFPYPHLTQEDLWEKYIGGYRASDVIIVPGTVPERTVRGYGKDFENKNIQIIPHGCDLPEQIKPVPKQFVVGMLGSMGMDKGARYLLEAWKKLAYRDSILTIGGRDSVSDYGKGLISTFGGGNLWIRGWMNSVTDFYNSISLLVCPAATEGFNIEVIEAMGHGRAVLCSDAAGAVDLVPDKWKVPACVVDVLANKIHEAKERWDLGVEGRIGRGIAEGLTWDNIKEKYKAVWRAMA